MSTMHLTEEQLDDQLIGDLAAEPAAHLAGCAVCQARVREAEMPLANFREMSLAWGERRSATLPVPVATEIAPARRFTRVHWLTGAAGLATAAVIVATALPANSRDESKAPQTATITHVAPAPAPKEQILPETTQTLAAVGHTGMKSVTPVAASPEQIDRDNQMLAAIDRELDAPRENTDAFGLVAAASNGR